MFKIYIIQNKINDKVYVGQSRNTRSRFSQHKSFLNKDKHHCEYLQRAWNKYGENAFDFYILQEYIDKESVNLAEEWYIQWYKDQALSYNSIGVLPGSGYITEEQRKQRRDSAIELNLIQYAKPRRRTKGYKFTEEERQIHSEAMKRRPGRSHTEAEKRRISESNRSRIVTEETKQKIANFHRGSVTSEETRKKLSEAKKGRKQSPEQIAKRVASRIGIRMSEETKQRIRETKRKKREGIV